MRILSATVTAPRNNAPADLMAAWLESRLKVSVIRKSSAGPGITSVNLETPGGQVVIAREDGKTASYAIPGQPRRTVALKRRDINGLLTEGSAASTRTRCTRRRSCLRSPARSYGAEAGPVGKRREAGDRRGPRRRREPRRQPQGGQGAGGAGTSGAADASRAQGGQVMSPRLLRRLPTRRCWHRTWPTRS